MAEALAFFEAGCFLVAKMTLSKLKSLLLQTVKYYGSVLHKPCQACYHTDIVLELIITTILYTLLIILFAAMAMRLSTSLRRFKVSKPTKLPHDLPTVTVCIPARNETHAMTQCLERVLASDYPKLEVIVFDDSSGDDTSILIRSFAHAGVRFVPGTKLPDGWLGKNHALDILANEASGDKLIFLDVDTFIESTTISQLVGYAETEKLAMVSVIPSRRDTWRANVVFGHLRYFWQLIIASQITPATSSSIWMINRDTLLDELGGMLSFNDDVQPEASIARLLGTQRYHCLLGTEELGVAYEKRWLSQQETSRRLLFPMAGGMPVTAGLALIALLVMSAPTIAILWGMLFGWGLFSSTIGLLVVPYILLYMMYTNRVWGGNGWLGGLVWPYVIAQELVMFVSSLWGYATHTITWKGRPVNAPTQRVTSLIINK